MVRVFGLLIVLGLAAFITWGIFQLAAKRANQRKLYRYNPELSDLPRPIVNRLAEQTRQLDSARRIMQDMLGDEINLYLPEVHKTSVEQWLSTYRKEIGK